MARLTKTQQTKITEAARRLVDGFGIANLDNIQDEEARAKMLRTLYRQLREETGTTYDTSRQKIAWACRRERHEMNTCQFCHETVFDGARSVGSVRQQNGTLKHYHLDCLYKAYPEETNYQRLVVELFSDKIGD